MYDFALRRRRPYVTILLDGIIGRQVDVLPDRNADSDEPSKWISAVPVSISALPDPPIKTEHLPRGADPRQGGPTFLRPPYAPFHGPAPTVTVYREDLEWNRPVGAAFARLRRYPSRRSRSPSLSCSP